MIPSLGTILPNIPVLGSCASAFAAQRANGGRHLKQSTRIS
jgi:hypothetical protein